MTKLIMLRPVNEKCKGFNSFNQSGFDDIESCMSLIASRTDKRPQHERFEHDTEVFNIISYHIPQYFCFV